MMERNYELRTLCADDIFPMVNIISKIGVENMADCFDAKEMSDVMRALNNASDESEDNSATSELVTQQIGIKVIMKLVGLVLGNLGKIKKDLYQFLSGISGMGAKEIAALPMGAFTQMIVDVFKKEEFSDFFQVVSGLLK